MLPDMEELALGIIWEKSRLSQTFTKFPSDLLQPLNLFALSPRIFWGIRSNSSVPFSSDPRERGVLEAAKKSLVFNYIKSNFLYQQTRLSSLADVLH